MGNFSEENFGLPIGSQLLAWLPMRMVENINYGNGRYLITGEIDFKRVNGNDSMSKYFKMYFIDDFDIWDFDGTLETESTWRECLRK